MISARHLTGAAVVVGVAVAVGCATKPNARARSAAVPPVKTAVAPAPAVAQTGSAPQFQPASPDATETPGEVTSRSLAEHSAQYARNVESMMSRRQRPQDDAAKSQASERAADYPQFGSADAETDASTFSTLPAATDTAHANAAMHVPDATDGMRQSVPQGEPAGPQARRAADGPATRPTTPARPPADAEPADAEPAGAKAPARAPAAASNDLLQKLSARIKADPRDAASHLNYQLLQFLLDEQVPELSSIAPLPAEDRELLMTLLDGLTNFRNGLRAETNALQAKKVAPLLELADRLRSQGDLSISTAALCRSVQRFGVYEPMEPPRFVAGKDSEAILYCEVANFS